MLLQSLLTLLRLETGIGFVDDIDATLAANNLVVGMAAFQRLD